MAKAIERVRLDDVYPLVDEYGNEFLNRDYSLDVNKEYVSELAASFKDGEPDEPIVVVRDGDVYRIKAGNSRVRAMKELGTQECWAIVDDEGTEQAINETVVRTNTKKKYEKAEESRFVQQLTAFGDDEYVGTVSGLGAEKAASVRRARAVAGDKAPQMSIDMLLALDEFDGYEDLQGKILGSLGKNDTGWRFDLESLRREKRNRAQIAAFEAEAAKMKIKLVKDRPGGVQVQYIMGCKNPEQLSEKYMEASVKYISIVGRLCDSWSGVSVDLYGEPIDSVAAKEAAEEAERQRKCEEFDDVIDSIDESTITWVRKILDRQGVKQETILKKMPALRDIAHDTFYDLYLVESALEDIPEGKGWGINIPAFVVGYMEKRETNCSFSLLVVAKQENSWRETNMRKYVEWIDAHVADGWKPDADQVKAIRAMRNRLDAIDESE